MTRNSKLLCFVPLLLLVFFSGCVSSKEEAGVFTATYQLWVGVGSVFLGLACCVGGWFWKDNDYRGWIFFVIAVVATIGFSPFGFVDYVKVSDQQLQTKWGFWIYPTTHDIKFDDVKAVDLTKEERRGRRGRKQTSYDLNFRMKDGSTEEVTATNALIEAAIEPIVEQLHKRDISVNNLTGE